MNLYCPHFPKVSIFSDFINSIKYSFHVCGKCRTDTDFADGFVEKKLK